MSERAYLLLGSNEGMREQFLQQAVDLLTQKAAINPPQLSSIYETAAWGLEEQPPFLNSAIGIDTALSPTDLLETIREIEMTLGRQRQVIWGQRTLDIDILLFGTQIMATADLQIPHPRLTERRFALEPLAEIAGCVLHPIACKTIVELLAACSDVLQVTKVIL